MLVALGLSACGSDDDSSASEAPASFDDAVVETFDTGGNLAIGGGESEAPADVAATGPATAGSASTGAPVGDFGRDLIVDAGVTMVTPNVGQAVDDVIAIATRTVVRSTTPMSRSTIHLMTDLFRAAAWS